MSEKVRSHHLERKAILYVRQSSVYQVNNHLESQKLQYAMQERLRHLGWHEIEVVDEDLGRSASGTVTRAGLERMIAEVCLGRVGAVAAREGSRFARNSREWQKLVEVCRVVDTLRRFRVGLPVLLGIIWMAGTPFLLAVPADLSVHWIGFNLATVVLPPMMPPTV